MSEPTKTLLHRLAACSGLKPELEKLLRDIILTNATQNTNITALQSGGGAAVVKATVLGGVAALTPNVHNIIYEAAGAVTLNDPPGVTDMLFLTLQTYGNVCVLTFPGSEIDAPDGVGNTLTFTPSVGATISVLQLVFSQDYWWLVSVHGGTAVVS